MDCFSKGRQQTIAHSGDHETTNLRHKGILKEQPHFTLIKALYRVLSLIRKLYNNPLRWPLCADLRLLWSGL